MNETLRYTFFFFLPNYLLQSSQVITTFSYGVDELGLIPVGSKKQAVYLYVSLLQTVWLISSRDGTKNSSGGITIKQEICQKHVLIIEESYFIIFLPTKLDRKKHNIISLSFFSYLKDLTAHFKLPILTNMWLFYFQETSVMKIS